MSKVPRTVLLVEDNADDEQLSLRALRQCDFPLVIQVARDGAEAVSLLERPHSIDLVLLDLKLPKLSGLEVLEHVRASAHNRTLPIVVVTSSDEERDIQESYRRGANSYIRKPIDFREFVDAMRQLGSYWLELNRQPRAR